jgi:hypothetical protein
MATATNTALTYGVLSVACASSILSGTISGSSISGSPSYSNCRYTLSGTTAVSIVVVTGTWTVTITRCSAGSCDVTVTIPAGASATIGAAPCVVSISGQQNVAARFTNTTHQLDVTSRTIRATASGVGCPLATSTSSATVSATYTDGTLTAS